MLAFLNNAWTVGIGTAVIAGLLLYWMLDRRRKTATRVHRISVGPGSTLDAQGAVVAGDVGTGRRPDSSRVQAVVIDQNARLRSGGNVVAGDSDEAKRP